MNPDNTYREFLELFFEGKLPDSEKAKLESMKRDPKFVEEYNRQLALWEIQMEEENKVIEETLGHFEIAEEDPKFRKMAESWLKNSEDEHMHSLGGPVLEKPGYELDDEPKRRSNNIRYLNFIRKIRRYAAVAILFIPLGIIWWANEFRSGAAIASEVYKPPRPERILGSGDKDLLHQGEREFSMGNFDMAIETLEQVTDSSDVLYSTARFYLGHSYFIEGKKQKEFYSEALDKFDWLINNIEKLPKTLKEEQDLKWYKALTLISMEKYKEANLLLTELDDPKYQEKIRILRKRMKWRFLIFN